MWGKQVKVKVKVVPHRWNAARGKKNPIKSGAAAFRKYKRLGGLADTTNIWREIENVVRMEIYNICV